jgi:LPXTG-motif cell wall-anchored protein
VRSPIQEKRRGTMKRYLLGGLAVAGLLLGGLAVSGGSASAEEVKPGQEVCGPLDSGKINTTGDPATITIPNAVVQVPEGYLISGYCVKAGSEQSVEDPDGPVQYVTLDPPVATITFPGPDGKAVSHYSVSFVKIPDESTTTTEATTTTTIEQTTTTAAATTTAAPAAPEGAVAAAGPVPPAAAPPAAAPAAATPTALPSTGSSSWGLALTALASLLGGLGLVKLSRRTS